MEKNERINSIQEWMNLPEVSLPVIGNDKGTGSVYTVLKVGFLAVSPTECRQMGIASEVDYGGKCILATAVVEFSEKRQLCRLPLGLTPWAFDCVALANAGRKLFPSRIEFGVLGGHTYAQHLP